MQVKQEAEVGQTLWILLNNKKKRKEKYDICTTQRCDTKQRTLKNVRIHKRRNLKSKRRPTINNNRKL